MALKNQQKQKKEDSKAYFIKIEERKAQLDVLQKGQQKVSVLKEKIPEIRQIFIEHFSFYESEL